MKEWYLRQTPRDQRIVVALTVLVLAVIFYAVLIHPLVTGLDDRRVRVNAAKEDVQFMLESAAKIKRAGGAGATQARPGNKAAYVLLDEAIRAAGLANAADRVEPAGRDKKGARAHFTQVDFDKLMRMLGTLQSKHGLGVTIANISRKDGGFVSARVTLEAG